MSRKPAHWREVAEVNQQIHRMTQQAGVARSSPPTARTSILVFCALAAALLGAAWFAFESQMRDVEAAARRNLANIATLKAGQITMWLHERRSDGMLFSGHVPMADLFGQWLRTGAAGDFRRDRLLQRLEAVRGNQDFRSILLLDPRARVRLGTADDAALAGVERRLALEAIRTRQLRLGDIELDGRGKPAMGMAAPLLAGPAADGAVAGVVYFRIDPGHFLYPLIESWPVESGTAETLLVRREGAEVRFLHRIRHLDAAPLTLRAALTDAELPATQAALGRTGAFHGRDYRGQRVTSYLLRIPDTGWGLVAKIDDAELYATAYRPAAYLFAVLIVALGFVAYIMWSLRSRAEQAYRGFQTELRNRVLAQGFSHLTNAANDMVIMADAAGRIVEVNDRTVEALGYSRGELLRMTLADLHTPEARAKLPAQLEEIDAGGGALHETEYRRKNGSRIAVEISVRVIDAAGTRYYQGIARNITERKRTEAALRLHERMTRHMQEGLILVRDADGTIAYANPRAETMFGYAAGELGGRHMTALIGPAADDAADIPARIMAALCDYGVWSGEIRNVRKDGGRFWCKTTVSGFEHPEYGRVWLSIHTDITEIKSLQQAQENHLCRIRRLGQHLMSVQESERRRLGAELHDRTSANLATVRLVLKELESLLPKPDAEARAKIEDLQALVADTNLTVRDISGNLRPPLLDFLGLAITLKDLAAKFGERTGVEVDVQAPPLPRLDGELETAIYRIVQEALTNCAKHAGATRVEVGLHAAGNRLVLVVADNGVGFITSGFHANGVGLVTMRDRTEFVDGSFSLESMPGRGTTIRAEIPYQVALPGLELRPAVG